MSQDFLQYHLETNISSNELSESWIGRNTKTSYPCFIKTTNLKSNTFSKEFKNTYLQDIYTLQKSIISSTILTPINAIQCDDLLLIEYPLLEKENWVPLTLEIFAGNFTSLLSKICLTLDSLHEYQLVHCDIKLENFLYNPKSKNIILTDLEFITRNNSPANTIVKGTSKYIAPEILNNDIITKTADYFSLSVILEELNNLSLPYQLIGIIEDLKNEYKNRKYDLLIDILLAHKLIDTNEHKTLLKINMGTKLLSDFYSKTDKSTRYNPETVKQLLSSSNNILGFNDEIVEIIADQFTTKRLATFRYIQTCIEQAEINKIGEFWLVKINENILISLLNSHYNLSHDTDLFARIDNLNKNHKFYSGYLVARYAEQHEADLHVEKRSVLYTHLSEYLFMLNRLDESQTYLEKKAETPEQRHLPEYIISLNRIYARKTQFDLSEKLLANALTLNLPNDISLRIQRYVAWVKFSQGDYETAETLLNELITKSQNDISLTCLIYYSLSVLNWYRSKPALAIEYSKKCLQLARKNHLDSEIVVAGNQLCVSYSDTSQYSKAVTYGNLALKHINSLRDVEKKGSLLLNTSMAYARLTKWKQAEQYLLESLNQSFMKYDITTLLQYYNVKGYLELHQGRYTLAKRTFNTTDKIAQGVSHYSLRKLYYNWYEAALYTGEEVQFISLYSKAKDYMEHFHDTNALLDLECLKFLEEYLYNGKNSPDNFLDIAQRLWDNKSVYLAVVAIFWYIVSYIEKTISVPPLPDWIHNVVQSEKVPLFQVMNIFINRLQALDNPSNMIFLLKEWFKIFYQADNLFYSGYIAHIIGFKYIEINNSKLAQKFFEKAKEIYSQISNDIFAERISDNIQNIRKHHKDDNTRLKIIRDISTLLTNIVDYDETLVRILNFSLEQTGAERAVLLYNNKVKGNLQVRAYLNCDENSLDDIERYSSSIINQVYQQDKPLIIDNAQKDEQMNQFKSIIKHNIQSVISIPIKHNDTIIGVLYLDHQTIPALFDNDDIVFSFTLANLLSVVLTLIDMVKNQKIINRELINEVNKYSGGSKFISIDNTISRLFERLPTMAKSSAPILLLGESGTGKEILADMIHSISNRSDKPFIKINCTAIPKELVETTLFGIEANVATGVIAREGKLSAADTGTLFIDEIGDMPYNVQTKILRAIEYQEFEKVGSNKTIKTDIRFIYATNKNLEQLMQQNKFREDLYYRISTIPIDIPPLRNRKDDIPLLINHFLKFFSMNKSSIIPTISSEAMIIFQQYNWPGNVRELKNLMERFCIMFAGKKITLQHIPEDIKKTIDTTQNLSVKEIVERSKIVEALENNRYIESRAAKEVGKSLSTFRRRRKKYNI